eukprot:389069_1
MQAPKKRRLNPNLPSQTPALSHNQLMKAIGSDDLQEVRRLLSICGDAVNQRDDWNGKTALIVAVVKGNVNAVGIILENKKIDVNKTDCYEKTPLYLAVKKGNIEIVQLFLKHPKVNVNKGCYPETPLYHA